MDEQQQPLQPQLPKKSPDLKLVQRGLIVMSGLLIVLAIAAVVVTITNDNKSADTVQRQKVAVIEITDDGFMPATLNIAPGTKVTWVNKTHEPYRIASNPYPELTDLPELDSKEPVGPDAEYSFVFEEAGTFGYHNYFEPTTNGEVVVK